MGESMGGMFTQNFKGQLDTGIAKSIYGQFDQFVNQARGEAVAARAHARACARAAPSRRGS